MEELIYISRIVGSDPDLVQGGGGNTSVKTRNEGSILVKASGTSLADMDRKRGWARLDLNALRTILSIRGLSSLPPEKREDRIGQLLTRTVVQPRGARPSVESNLHALLDRVVIHIHPVGLNTFLCSRRSRELYLDVVGKPRGEPLYVPYTDPGYILASRMKREIERYRKRFGYSPAVVLLENHGLFVAAPEVESCLRLLRKVTEAGRRFVGGGRVNPLVFPSTVSLKRRGDAPPPALIRGALLRGGAAPVLVRRDESHLAREFLKKRSAVRSALRGAFTPDQIVYCRTYPLVLRASRPDRFRETVQAYRRSHRCDPRVVLVPGSGVYYAAPDPKQIRIVAEVYRGAMAAILGSSRAGGPRFLTRTQAGFIEGWEVEAYRARLSRGAIPPLSGRVGLVMGVAKSDFPAAAQDLLKAGAVLFLLDQDFQKISRLAARLGPSCVPVECNPMEQDSVQSAFTLLEDSAGGIDFILDMESSRIPSRGGPKDLLESILLKSILSPYIWSRFLLFREAKKLFLRQGAGGEFAIATDFSSLRKKLPAREMAAILEKVLRGFAGAWEADFGKMGIRVNVFPHTKGAVNSLIRG